MIYTNFTRLAMKIAFETHKDQVDKAGVPYIYHPIHLAEQMNDENTIIVALLHDVVEDSSLTFEDLLELGFLVEVVDALRLLSHDENEDYFVYIKKISENEIATIVKIADLKHNSDLTRFEKRDEKSLLRIKKYQQSLDYLENRSNS